MSDELPKHVDGYDAARSANRLPVVPMEPPAIAVRPTANSAIRVFVVKSVVAAIVVFALIKAVSVASLPALVTTVLMLAIGLSFFPIVFASMRTVGAQGLKELELGYTTLQLVVGAFTLTVERRWYTIDFGLPWSYEGIWVLDNNGKVLSEPNRDVDPPGFYPSPNRPGMFELWTGKAWSNQFR